MNKLEAQAIVENTGNYDEEDIEYIMDIYDRLTKHIGFKDERRDNRYIVKFHDIFYYMPDEYYREHNKELDSLFDSFCYDQAEYINEVLLDKNIDIDSMLHPMCVGSYQPFLVDIDEITIENAADLAMKIYDQCGIEGVEYPYNYVYTVQTLKDLEDNYMDYWIEFLEGNEYLPKKIINEIKKKYKSDKERRK